MDPIADSFGDGVTGERIQEFSEKWGLDERARSFLETLPEVVIEAVLQGFDPPPDTRNINGRLQSFARGIAADKGHPELGPQGGAPWQRGDRQSGQASQGGYGGRGGGYAHRDDRDRDRDRDRGGYGDYGHGSRGGGGSGRTPWRGIEDREISDFVRHWNLDEKCEDALRNEPPEVVKDIMISFRPPEDTRNVNGRFMTFLKSREGPPPATSGQRRRGDFQYRDRDRDRDRDGRDGWAGREQRREHWESPGIYQTEPLWGPSQDDIRRFVRRWRLDEKSSLQLGLLSPEQLQRVLSDFDPPTNTNNINAKLMSFVRAVQDKPAEAPPMVYASRSEPLRAPMVRAASPRPPPRGQQVHDELRRFVRRWDLDDKNSDLLRDLGRDELLKVIADFNPPPGTQNYNAKLHSFVRSFMDRLSKEGSRAPIDPVEAFASRWQLDDDAVQCLRALPPDAQRVVMDDFAPPPGTMNVSGRLKAFIRRMPESRMSAAAGPPQPYAQPPRGGERSHRAPYEDQGGGYGSGPSASSAQRRFIEDWGLDDAARGLLDSLPADLAAAVMHEFVPPPGTRNTSARFQSFVKTKLKDEGIEMPRPRDADQHRDRDYDREERRGVKRDRGHEESPHAGVPAAGELWEGAVRDFCQRWDLDDRSEALLGTLSEDLLSEVLIGFEPDEATRNKNAKLAIWIRNLQDAERWGKRARQS